MKKRAGALAGVFALAGLIALFSLGPTTPALAAPPEEGEQPNAADPTGSPAQGQEERKVTICYNGHPITIDRQALSAHLQNHDGDALVGGVVGGADVAEPSQRQEEEPQGDTEGGCQLVDPTTQQPTEETALEETAPVPEEGPNGAQEEGDEPEDEIGDEEEQTDVATVETCDGESMELRPEEERTLKLHNGTRTQHGLEPLCVDRELTRAARSHSRDMIEKRYFSHTSPSGETLGSRLERSGYGYRTAGENLAWGTGPHATPEDTLDRWMESPGHRENVLDGGFREVGVGVATGEYEGGGRDAATMYTVDFGTPSDAAEEARAAVGIEGG
jgi:uncharacterized protein YkwD